MLCYVNFCNWWSSFLMYETWLVITMQLLVSHITIYLLVFLGFFSILWIKSIYKWSQKNNFDLTGFPVCHRRKRRHILAGHMWTLRPPPEQMEHGGQHEQKASGGGGSGAQRIPLCCWWVQEEEIPLTHWGRMTHICIGKLTIIASDNGLLAGRHQAIIWAIAGILLMGPLDTNFSETLIGIQTFSFKKMHLKISYAKWRPFCRGLNVLKP